MFTSLPFRLYGQIRRHVVFDWNPQLLQSTRNLCPNRVFVSFHPLWSLPNADALTRRGLCRQLSLVTDVLFRRRVGRMIPLGKFCALSMAQHLTFRTSVARDLELIRWTGWRCKSSPPTMERAVSLFEIIHIAWSVAYSQQSLLLDSHYRRPCQMSYYLTIQTR